MCVCICVYIYTHTYINICIYVLRTFLDQYVRNLDNLGDWARGAKCLLPPTKCLLFTLYPCVPFFSSPLISSIITIKRPK